MIESQRQEGAGGAKAAQKARKNIRRGERQQYLHVAMFDFGEFGSNHAGTEKMFLNWGMNAFCIWCVQFYNSESLCNCGRCGARMSTVNIKTTVIV